MTPITPEQLSALMESFHLLEAAHIKCLANSTFVLGSYPIIEDLGTLYGSYLASEIEAKFWNKEHELGEEGYAKWVEARTVVQMVFRIPLSADTLYYLTGSGLILDGDAAAAKLDTEDVIPFTTARSMNFRVRASQLVGLSLASGDTTPESFLATLK